jgi:hypothetical protein
MAGRLKKQGQNYGKFGLPAGKIPLEIPSLRLVFNEPPDNAGFAAAWSNPLNLKPLPTG